MTASPRPRRSVLFLPAANPRAVEKARTLDCDVVVLDLEDAVAPDEKARGRADALAALKQGGFGRSEVVVRANGLTTPWGADDLAAIRGSSAAAVIVPKISSPEELAACAAQAGNLRIWAMIETAQAVLSVDAIARSCAQARTDVLVVGVNDLAKDMRCRPGADRAPLWTGLSMTVMAARAHGLTVLDGVYNILDDLPGLERECAQGVDFGFDGKSLIHPSHIPAANAAFRPDPAALAKAARIVAAFDSPENQGKGVLSLEGRMVERLHLDDARRLMAVGAAIAAHEGS